MNLSSNRYRSNDLGLPNEMGSNVVEMIKQKELKSRGTTFAPQPDALPGQRLREFLEENGHKQARVAAEMNSAVDGLLTMSLLSSLKISPEFLGQLTMMDRCLLSLLTIDSSKPMSTGRLAWLASDLFVEITVNLVRERMAAIGAAFAGHGHSDLLTGDYLTGFSLKV